MLMTIIVITFLIRMAQSQPNVLYVRADNGSSCPQDIPVANCQTLEWYIQNINASFTSNTTMVFLKGSHSLESFVEIANCYNFNMTGAQSILQGRDGLPQPASWINCERQSNNGLLFVNSSKIHISNLGLESCSGQDPSDHFRLYAALSFDRVSDITLQYIVINNTSGFGLYCENVFGRINVMGSIFMNAHGHRHDSVKIDAGNARFLFGNPCPDKETNLTIDSSLFQFGNESTGQYLKNEVLSRTDGTQFTGHNFKDASGLQYFVLCPGIHVKMENITAEANRGSNGGNIAIVLEDVGPTASDIIINNSRIIKGYAKKGGGIRVWLKIKTKEDVQNISSLSVFNSIFTENYAKSSGGAIYVSFDENEKYFLTTKPREVNIVNCMFKNNRGGNAAVMEILQEKIAGYNPHFTPQLSLNIINCTFHSNSEPSHKHISIMEMVRTKRLRVSDCNFTNNHGHVFSLRSANLNFYRDIRFVNNSANYGAALKVCDGSLVFLHNGTNILFYNNSAKKGGAVYAEQGCMDTPPACLFQPASIYQVIDIKDLDDYIRMKFANNSASLAGDAIYGGSLDYCYILYYTFHKHNGTNYYNNENIFLAIFDTTKQEGPSNITSDPQGVCFCDSLRGVQRCSLPTDTAKVAVFPGQKFSISLTTIGQYKGESIGLIDANLVDAQPADRLINLNNTLIPHRGCTDLAYRVISTSFNARINFTIVGSDGPVRYNHGNNINATLPLSILTCPLAFELTSMGCVCHSLINRTKQPTCDIDTQLIHMPKQSYSWFGCEDDDKHHHHHTSHCNLAVSLYCTYYCTSNASIVNVSNVTSLDNQCLPGHTGILCGSCKPGLSRTLGMVSKCKACSNWNLLILIPVILLSGIVLIILIMFLNMTVTEGTLNGIVIYANIMYTHQRYLPDYGIMSTICRIFIAWFNFDISFDLCFYNGMKGYHYIWLIYGYTFYLIAIQIVIIFLCRKFFLFTRLFGRNIIKVLASVVFLVYSPLLYAIIQTVQFTILQISKPNGTHPEEKYVWYFDGNIQYLGTKHIPLFIVGVLSTIVVLWFTCSLLLVQCLQRTNLICCKWVGRLKPFFDAFTGPCHDNYRFWPGFLQLMRFALYCLNTVSLTFTHSIFNQKLTSLTTTVVCVLILSFSCIFPHGVYKKWPLNVLEFSFFLNLCITSALWTIATNSNIHSRVVHTSVSIAILTFLATVTYHIWTKFKNVCKCRKMELYFQPKNYIRRFCFSNDSQDDTESTPILPQPLPLVINYEQYREPLIGGNTDS